MEFIQCTNCLREQPVNLYSPQKTKPHKLYAWCNPCRREGVRRNKPGLAQEWADMRAKAKTLGLLDAADDQQIAEHYAISGVVSEVAMAWNVGHDTIKRSLIRTHSLH